VLDAMGDALTPSHIILCNATIGPEATIEAARLVQERGAQFLDAPFTGSKTAAEKREMVYYIGGEDKTLAFVEPVLKASGKAIVKIGKIGDAATVKVATNMIAAVTVQTLAEAYAIVKGSGIEPSALAEALKVHGARSALIDDKLAKILDRNYEPHFSLKHMFKDVQLGIHVANSLDIDLPATTSTAGVMYGGLTRGWADEDYSVLARTYQKENEPAPLFIAPPLKPLEKAAPVTAPATAPAPVQAAPAPIAPPALESAPVTPTLTPPAAEIAPTLNQAIESSPSPAPAAEKKEPPRESTADELRDIGINVPSPAAPPSPPAEPTLAVVDKTPDPALIEAAKPELPKSAEPSAEPAKAEAPKLDGAPEKGADATAPGESTDGKPAVPPNNTNGVPGEPARTHTPFVRIRRWFGTGTPS